MDFVLELFLQLIVQVVFEVLAEGAFELFAKTRVGRWLVGMLVGGCFGVAWGTHLSGGAHPPKLLWVSAASAVLAFGAAFVTVNRQRPEPMTFWDVVVQPPWEWSVDRYLAFGLMNVGIAIGIVLGYSPAVS